MITVDELFKAQQKLRDRISYNEPDRAEKIVTALTVELGEMMNEYQGFKFWSQDQKPRTKEYKGDQFRNPLLEEYADVLHFVLELGIEYDLRPEIKVLTKEDTIEKTYLAILDYTILIWRFNKQFKRRDLLEIYSNLWARFFELGECFGFTEYQIEHVYADKNWINHLRQSEGY